MTKANLIDEISRASERTKKEAEQIIDAVLDAVAHALAKGDKVDLRGFGSFQVSGRERAAGPEPENGRGADNRRAERRRIQTQQGTRRASQRDGNECRVWRQHTERRTERGIRQSTWRQHRRVVNKKSSRTQRAPAPAPHTSRCRVFRTELTILPLTDPPTGSILQRQGLLPPTEESYIQPRIL